MQHIIHLLIKLFYYITFITSIRFETTVQVKIFFNQVFNENRVIVMLKSAAGGGWAGVRASTFGFRSKTLVCFGLLTPNLLYR